MKALHKVVLVVGDYAREQLDKNQAALINTLGKHFSIYCLEKGVEEFTYPVEVTEGGFNKVVLTKSATPTDPALVDKVYFIYTSEPTHVGSRVYKMTNVMHSTDIEHEARLILANQSIDEKKPMQSSINALHATIQDVTNTWLEAQPTRFTRNVFLLLDQSAYDAFLNDEQDLLATNEEYTSHRLLAPVFTKVPPEEDQVAFQEIHSYLGATKIEKFARRYFICADTTHSIPAHILNALIDNIKEAGNNYTYINTCNRDMRQLWDYLLKSQPKERSMNEKAQFHPKTVNLVLSGFNATAVAHDGRFNIAGLLDEMIARGGRIFTFRQKDQSPAENLQEAKDLIAHLKDPQRHPQTQYIVLTSNSRPATTPEADEAIQASHQIMSQTVEAGNVNFFSFDAAKRTAEISEILYTALYQMLAPSQFQNPIVPSGVIVNANAVTEIRNQLLHAQNALRAVGMAVNMIGLPPIQQPMGQGMNYQPFPYGQAPFRNPGLCRQPYGDFDGDCGDMVRPPFGSEMYGFAPYQPQPMGGFPFQMLEQYSGRVVVHYVGDEQEKLARQAAERIGKMMPRATIIPVGYEETQDIDTIVETVANKLAWRTQKPNIHLVMMLSTDPGFVPAVDHIADGICRSIAAQTDKVDTVRYGEIITGPVLSHKLLALVTNMKRYPMPSRHWRAKPAGEQLHAKPQLSVDELSASLREFDGVVVFHSVGVDASIAVEEAWKGYLNPIMTSADFKHYNYSLTDENRFELAKTNVSKDDRPKQLHVVVSDARFAMASETVNARIGCQVHAAIAQTGNISVGLSTPEDLKIVSTTLDSLYHLKLSQQARSQSKF